MKGSRRARGPAEHKAILTPLKRTGLHRLVCSEECGSAVYMTLTQVERGPLPSCGCGAPFWPEHPELAMRVLPEPLWLAHPWIRAYRREDGSILEGQASHVQQGHKMHANAQDRVARQMSADARARRLAGLRQNTIAAEQVAGMAF